MKHFTVFFFQYRPMRIGNQDGGRVYDDVQHLLDITSHQNPLYGIKQMTGTSITVQNPCLL